MIAVDPDLRHVAVRLADMLGPDQCMVVGALAVAVHGYPRATDDVDLLTRLDLTSARRLLHAHGVDPIRRRADPVRDFPRLTGAIEGIRFDVIPEVVPVEWDHAVRLPFGRKEIKIVDFDGLLRLKLRAGGPQDLMDAAHLLLQHPEHLAKARQVSRTYRLEEKLEMWLKDSRVRAKADGEVSRRQEGERNRGSDG